MQGGPTGSSGFGGMMGGMRGLTAGSMNAPTEDSLTDEGVVGAAYDHKVVMRLATYLREAKGDAIRAVASVLVYTAASVSIPLFLMLVLLEQTDGVVLRMSLEIHRTKLIRADRHMHANLFALNQDPNASSFQLCTGHVIET